MVKLEVDFPLFVAPIASKCLSNNVSGYKFSSWFAILTTLANDSNFSLFSE